MRGIFPSLTIQKVLIVSPTLFALQPTFAASFIIIDTLQDTPGSIDILLDQSAPQTGSSPGDTIARTWEGQAITRSLEAEKSSGTFGLPYAITTTTDGLEIDSAVTVEGTFDLFYRFGDIALAPPGTSGGNLGFMWSADMPGAAASATLTDVTGATQTLTFDLGPAGLPAAPSSAPIEITLAAGALDSTPVDLAHLASVTFHVETPEALDGTISRIGIQPGVVPEPSRVLLLATGIALLLLRRRRV